MRKVRLQIHHLLIGPNCVAQLSLLHQRIAEKTVIKAKSPLLDETPRQRFGFFEAMRILQHVRMQQRRFLALRIALFDAPCALLGQFVKTRVETSRAFTTNAQPSRSSQSSTFLPSRIRPCKWEISPSLRLSPAAASAPSPSELSKAAVADPPCSVRSCSFVKEKRRAEKQWPGTAPRRKSKKFRSVSWKLCRHVVCKFPFFAFGEH